MTFCSARNYCKPSRGLAAVPGHGRKVEWGCLHCRGTVPLPKGLLGVPVPLLAPPLARLGVRAGLWPQRLCRLLAGLSLPQGSSMLQEEQPRQL